MTLPHIFISHASLDAKVASDLAEHLRNAGHDSRVDTHQLGLGDDLIKFMNDSIAEAHTIVILWSEASQRAKWQSLEINAAIWSEIEASGGKCIVVKLDDTPLPPLLGPKVFGKLDPTNREETLQVVTQLCKAVLPSQSPSGIVAAALKRDSKNPFRHLRAEFFEDLPHLHVKAFAQPDPVTVGSLEDMKPCFLEGSRGTGKSMLLLSLRARNRLLRIPTSRTTPDVFGFYLKLTRGAICNAGSLADLTGPSNTSVNAQLADLTEQELALQLIESLVSEISYCGEKSIIAIDRLAESTLSNELARLLFDVDIGVQAQLRDLLDGLQLAHRDLARFIRRRFIYRENVGVPAALPDFNQVRRCIDRVRRHVPDLGEAMFTVLLDEYENLFPYQQRIVNTLVKLGPPALSVKVAKKIGVDDTSGTATGQELQEKHDYTRIALVYDLDDAESRQRYRNLLREFVKNMLICEGLPLTEMAELLPVTEEPEVESDMVISEVAELCKVSESEFLSWPDQKRSDKMLYYGQAAVYRSLAKRQGLKRFQGFDELSFVSSGVIRYFQEILGVAYHLTYGSGPIPAGQPRFPVEHQTRAVHLVSQHSLTTLSRNVERHGEELKYFMMDLGDCIRHKLLKHTSEPEAARLTLQDPESLNNSEMSHLRLIMQIGVREGVFQGRPGMPAFRPKHETDPQPAEYNIGRIFAPVLGLSPRLRWRTPVSCKSLNRLLDPMQRQVALAGLKSALVREPDRSQAELGLDR
jgi:hypothetical protein